MMRVFVAPLIIIYDNSCNAKDFCDNREPEYFKDTHWFVDRTHYQHHIRCTEGFDLDTFEHMGDVNSQVAEQVNSLLSTRIGTQVQYMTQEHFMISIRNFFEETNHNKIEELNVKLQDKCFREKAIAKLSDICKFYEEGSPPAIHIQMVIDKLRNLNSN